MFISKDHLGSIEAELYAAKQAIARLGIKLEVHAGRTLETDRKLWALMEYLGLETKNTPANVTVVKKGRSHG